MGTFNTFFSFSKSNSEFKDLYQSERPINLSILLCHFRTVIERLDVHQALVKQFAHMLKFVLLFDEHKMAQPALQNDISYFRRTSQAHRNTPGSRYSAPMPIVPNEGRNSNLQGRYLFKRENRASSFLKCCCCHCCCGKRLENLSICQLARVFVSETVSIGRTLPCLADSPFETSSNISRL